MGTSKSRGTPTGGGWTGFKGAITRQFNSGGRPSPSMVVSGALSAAGGLASAVTRGGSHSVTATSIAAAGAGLAGFGSYVQSEGLSATLARLNLRELEGRPALEVVHRIAQHLAEVEFLARLVFEAIWSLVEQHMQAQGVDERELEAVTSAVEAFCRAEVRTRIEEARSDGVTDATDWFAADGRAIALEIVNDLESRLVAAGQGVAL